MNSTEKKILNDFFKDNFSENYSSNDLTIKELEEEKVCYVVSKSSNIISYMSLDYVFGEHLNI